MGLHFAYVCAIIVSMKGHYYRFLILSLLFGAGLVSLFGLSSGVVNALTYQSEADVVFTFSPTMTLNVSGDLIIDNLSPGNSADSNIVTVTAGSNSAAGYTVYANVGNSSNNYTDLRISSSDTTNKFRALTIAGTIGNGEWGYSYCTGTCSESAGTWVYGSTGSTSNGYGALPLYNDNSHSGDVVLANENSANTTNLSFKIGAKAAPAQAMGTYTNVVNFIGVPKVVTTSYTITYDGNSATSGVPSQQTGTTTEAIVTLNGTAPIKNGYTFMGWCDVSNTSNQANCSGNIVQPGHTYALNTTNPTFTKTFYAVWEENCPPNYICYKANGSNVIGTMGKQSISASATSATLLASNFSRTGYGFAGWSDSMYPATDSSAHLYGPNETITFTAGQYSGSNGGLILYAVWIASAGNMQTQASSVCSSLTTAPTNGTATLASVSALTDQRDNQTYAIAKLADGKCWMIENLRLDNTAELTLANTNNPLNNGTNVTLKHNYTDTDTYNTLSATSSVAYDADTAPDGWCTSNSSACDDQSRLRTDNTANRATYTSGQIVSSQNANTYSYGNYYNWYSATAGRGTYSFSTNNNSVAGDLCPAGWRLPKGGNKTRIESDGDNEFWNLAVVALNNGTLPANYSSSTYPYYTGTEAGPVDKALRTYPNNYLYSGYVIGGSVSSRGSYGNVWSSTAYNSYNAYDLYLDSSSVNPGADYNNKYYGRTVRCVAQWLAS